MLHVENEILEVHEDLALLFPELAVELLKKMVFEEDHEGVLFFNVSIYHSLNVYEVCKQVFRFLYVVEHFGFQGFLYYVLGSVLQEHISELLNRVYHIAYVLPHHFLNFVLGQNMTLSLRVVSVYALKADTEIAR